MSRHSVRTHYVSQKTTLLLLKIVIPTPVLQPDPAILPLHSLAPSISLINVAFCLLTQSAL